MITEKSRYRCFVLGATVAMLFQAQAIPAAERYEFVYLQRADDPFYAPRRAYTGLTLQDRFRPIDGAKVAIRESKIIGRALGLSFDLHVSTLGADDAAADVIERHIAADSHVFLLDLPLDDVAGIAARFADPDVVLFNIRHPDDRLRGEACSRALFHTLPSRAMLTDGLAQFLSTKGWRKVLVLEGQTPADKTLSRAFQRSARKFGLDVVDARTFVLGHDPRLRDQNNVALLTAGEDYDVVYVADALGEFGRYVPYNTQLARPVVGTEGLQTSAWHWTWERHGAPQLNQRFDRSSERRMTDTDFAAWIAVRSVIEAMVRTKTSDTAVLHGFLSSADLRLDTYKGAPSSFRPWDNQLRQAILVHRHNAVIAQAPLAGFLHERNNLDTLGSDDRESTCRQR